MPSRADRAGAVATGEPDEAIRQLIATGVEQGYLLREDIDAVLPVDVTVSSVLNDLLRRCRDAGIAVDAASLAREGADDARTDEPDLTPSRLDPSSDVVRLYFADMGRGKLLTRDAEVALAKRLEHGQRTVMVAISQTPSLVQQVIRLGDALRDDARLIQRLVTHDHGEVTATRLTTRARAVIVQIDAVRAALDRGACASSLLAADARTTSASRPARPVAGVARARTCSPADAPHRVQSRDSARPHRRVQGRGSHSRGGTAGGRDA